MSNIFTRSFKRDKSLRMDQNEWAALAEYFNFGGNSYPITMGSTEGQASESIDSDFDAYVRQGVKQSGVVFSALKLRVSIFTEARFQFQRMSSGRPGDLFGTPALGVLENPWLNGQTADLLARAIQDTDIGGNFYAVQEGLGTPQSPHTLRRLRPDWVDILLSNPPDQAVSADIIGYCYRPGGTLNRDLWEMYPIDGSNGIVVHWAPFPDPQAQYRGMSLMTSVLTEITSDKAAIDHKQKFFETAATPPIAISFKDTVSAEQFKDFRREFRSAHAGVRNAYEPLFLGGGADVKVLGATLMQTDFSKTAGHGEARILAALGVHPLLVGLSEEQVRTALSVSNLQAAKNLLIDAHMRPAWRSFSQALSVLFPTMRNARLWYDDRDIAFLREDRQAAAEVKAAEATTIGGLINNGFTPDSVILAMVNSDWRLLEHTGLVSVQLQIPGQPLGGGSPETDPASSPDANEPDPSGKANTPDAADKGKANQPPDPTDDQE